MPEQPDTLGPTVPKVSVIMPAHNAANTIQEAIASVLEQDYPNKELIIIDDGSTDATRQIVSDHQPAVMLLTQTNQGAGAARNLGITRSQGEYIAFIDADDIWLPGKLSHQVQHLQSMPQVDMVYTRWLVWSPPEPPTHPAPTTAIAPASGAASGADIVPEHSGWLYNRLLFTSLLLTSTVVMRRSLVDRVGLFSADLKRGQDYDYWLRASRLTPIDQIDQPYVLYRRHGQGCAIKWPDRDYEFEVIHSALQRWGPEGPGGERTPTRAIRTRLGALCFDFGYDAYWSGRPHIATRCFFKALRYQPLRTQAWLYGLLSAAQWVRQTVASRRHH